MVADDVGELVGADVAPAQIGDGVDGLGVPASGRAGASAADDLESQLSVPEPERAGAAVAQAGQVAGRSGTACSARTNRATSTRSAPSGRIGWAPPRSSGLRRDHPLRTDAPAVRYHHRPGHSIVQVRPMPHQGSPADGPMQPIKSSGPPGGVAGCRTSDLEVWHGGQPLAGDPRGASRAGR